MKRLISLSIILGLNISIPSLILAQGKITAWEVYFSPNGGSTNAIVRELDKAQSTVLVQAYPFTSYKITGREHEGQSGGLL